MDAMHKVHVVVTMAKRKLHDDGADHSESSIAGRRRSWEDDIDASWTTKDKEPSCHVGGGRADGWPDPHSVNARG